MRAISASLVVADQALLQIADNSPENRISHLAWALGDVGVYVSFVISGFIMVYISWESFGRRAAPADFLWRRLGRIVPLYWLATLTAMAYHRVSVAHGAHADGRILAAHSRLSRIRVMKAPGIPFSRRAGP